jgi:hypothetical protein
MDSSVSRNQRVNPELLTPLRSVNIPFRIQTISRYVRTLNASLLFNFGQNISVDVVFRVDGIYAAD